MYVLWPHVSFYQLRAFHVNCMKRPFFIISTFTKRGKVWWCNTYVMIGSDRTLYIKLNNKSRYDTKTQKQLCNKASAFIPFLLWKFHFPSSSQITHVHLYCRIFIGLTFTFFGAFSIFPNIFLR